MTALPPANSDRQQRSFSCEVVLETLKKRQDFLSCAKASKWVTPAFLVQARKRDDGMHKVRIGYTASKKVGGAVERNRAKRRLRALVRDVLKAQVKPGYDIVLVARKKDKELPWESMKRDLIWAMKRLDIKRDEEK